MKRKKRLDTDRQEEYNGDELDSYRGDCGIAGCRHPVRSVDETQAKGEIVRKGFVTIAIHTETRDRLDAARMEEIGLRGKMVALCDFTDRVVVDGLEVRKVRKEKKKKDKKG